MFCARLFICALWSPAGKGLTSWLSFVVSTVSLSLSHWYPGSDVVLNCIDSWSLHPYLLLCFSVLCLLSLCARLFICALWSPAWKGLTSLLSFVVSNCEFVTFPLVFWVRCGTCCIDSWSLHPWLLCSTSELRVRLVPSNWFKPSSKIFYWPFPGGISSVDHFCYLCLVFVMLSRLFIAAVWSPAGTGLISWLLFVMFNCVFYHFPMWYPVLCVVLDCIVS